MAANKAASFSSLTGQSPKQKVMMSPPPTRPLSAPSTRRFSAIRNPSWSASNPIPRPRRHAEDIGFAPNISSACGRGRQSQDVLPLRLSRHVVLV